MSKRKSSITSLDEINVDLNQQVEHISIEDSKKKQRDKILDGYRKIDRKPKLFYPNYTYEQTSLWCLDLSSKLTGSYSRVLVQLFATFGFESEKQLAISYLSNATGIGRSHISECIKRLISLGWIEVVAPHKVLAGTARVLKFNYHIMYSHYIGARDGMYDINDLVSGLCSTIRNIDSSYENICYHWGTMPQEDSMMLCSNSRNIDSTIETDSKELCSNSRNIDDPINSCNNSILYMNRDLDTSVALDLGSISNSSSYSCSNSWNIAQEKEQTERLYHILDKWKSKMDEVKENDVYEKQITIDTIIEDEPMPDMNDVAIMLEKFRKAPKVKPVKPEPIDDEQIEPAIVDQKSTKTTRERLQELTGSETLTDTLLPISRSTEAPMQSGDELQLRREFDEELEKLGLNGAEIAKAQKVFWIGLIKDAIPPIREGRFKKQNILNLIDQHSRLNRLSA